MRDVLKGLDLDKETIDTIMAEYGKTVQGLKEQVEDYKTKITNYETKVTELTSKAQTNEDTQKELEKLKEQIADRALDDTINKAIGNRKFVNDYTKNAIIDGIKKGLNEENNKGKSIEDILGSLTEGQEGIFVEEKANTQQTKATGTQIRTSSAPSEDDGVMAILKSKHPNIEF